MTDDVHLSPVWDEASKQMTTLGYPPDELVRKPDPWPVIDWLADNMPRALELCPYKVPLAAPELELVVYGEAVAAVYGKRRIGHGTELYLKPHAREWRRNIEAAAGHARRGKPLLNGPLELDLRFYLPRPKAHYGARGLRPSAPNWPTGRPDALKLARNVEDALTGIVWRDDAQVCRQTAAKAYGEPARVVIAVRCLPDLKGETA